MLAALLWMIRQTPARLFDEHSCFANSFAVGRTID
jgi:hypothetical protein